MMRVSQSPFSLFCLRVLPLVKMLPSGSEQRQPKEHDIASHPSTTRSDTARPDKTRSDSPLRLDPSTRRRDRELDRITGCQPPKMVSIPLAQATKLLLDASESNRAWLHDFADDVIRVDADLYEVLLAYQDLNKQVA